MKSFKLNNCVFRVNQDQITRYHNYASRYFYPINDCFICINDVDDNTNINLGKVHSIYMSWYKSRVELKLYSHQFDDSFVLTKFGQTLDFFYKRKNIFNVRFFDSILKLKQYLLLS